MKRELQSETALSCDKPLCNSHHPSMIVPQLIHPHTVVGSCSAKAYTANCICLAPCITGVLVQGSQWMDSVCVCTCMHVCVCVHACVCARVCMHARTRARTHTHTLSTC